jgi:hypothetical protein
VLQANGVEKRKPLILCPITFFFENPALYEMWKNNVEPGRPQMTIWRMRHARRVPKAANTYSEYVTLIAFRCYVIRTVHCLFRPRCLLFTDASPSSRTVTNAVAFTAFGNLRLHYLNISLEVEHVIIYRMSILS